ncbi:MAG TPA: ribbon-helix-helix domain-containing protein [Pseudolabrys sp.]|nr:ribbon-helix-helix domain-containing protein [Pseudolabrys sp.]
MTKAIKSAVAKRSVVIGGHKTSVSLEEPFWNEVRTIAAASQVSVSNLLQKIDGERQNGNLSSAIRVFVLQHLREQSNLPNRSGAVAVSRSTPVELGL